jgi:ABC-type nitrate/sulfonate/bicarbonate transport system substrate-binding protein
MKTSGDASKWDQCGRRCFTIFGIVSVVLLFFETTASSLDTIYMAITPGKNFQHVIYPIAQEKGYMREEGIDLKLLIVAGTPSIQGLLAGSIQFTVAGTSALIAAAKGAAPLKVVLAANDKVHQWLLSKPEITSLKSLKGKRIATGGVAASATFMLKQISSGTASIPTVTWAISISREEPNWQPYCQDQWTRSSWASSHAISASALE